MTAIKTLLSDRPIRTQRDVAALVSDLKAEVERRVLEIEAAAVLRLIDAGHTLHEAAAIVRSCRPTAELVAVIDDINQIERAADLVRLGTH